MELISHVAEVKVLLVRLASDVLFVCLRRLELEFKGLELCGLVTAFDVTKRDAFLESAELLLISFFLLRLVSQFVPKALHVRPILCCLV